VAGLKALELVRGEGLVVSGGGGELRARLHENAQYMRKGLEQAGFTLKPGRHPIIPVMLGDAALAVQMADRLLQRGIYVIGFSYPVVPQGQARIRIQLSAAHTREQLDHAVQAFREVGQELRVLSAER
jgi:glycine C-acetyltransferase